MLSVAIILACLISAMVGRRLHAPGHKLPSFFDNKSLEEQTLHGGKGRVIGNPARSSPSLVELHKSESGATAEASWLPVKVPHWGVAGMKRVEPALGPVDPPSRALRAQLSMQAPGGFIADARPPLPPSEQLLPLRIDGTWYDCAKWADTHPGGRWLLEYASGRDVTALFSAIHLYGEAKAKVALQKLPRIEEADLPLPSRTGLPPSVLEEERALQGPFVVEINESVSTPLPTIDSPLRRDLQAMLQRRFPTREAMKATPAHWAATSVAGFLTLSCWAGWLRFDPLAVFLLPFAQWVLAAHTVHEATHGALSTNPQLNFWMQFTSHPILFNVFVWIPQHLLSHHQYSNNPQHDVDVHHFAPARLSALQPPYVPDAGKNFNEGWTFVWKGCLTTLGTCILQPLRTLTEKPTPNFDVNLTPIPAAVSKWTLLLSMLPSVFVLLYPLVALGSGAAASVPLAQVLLAEVWPWVGMSLIWTLMTQTSHVQAICQPNHPLAKDEPDCWTAKQIGAALDYSVDSAVVASLTAGLNSQGLHHAMPFVSMAHFPDMYREYEEICRRNGVTPRQMRDLTEATTEMLDYIFDLNDPTGPSAGGGGGKKFEQAVAGAATRLKSIFGRFLPDEGNARDA